MRFQAGVQCKNFKRVKVNRKNISEAVITDLE